MPPAPRRRDEQERNVADTHFHTSKRIFAYARIVARATIGAPRSMRDPGGADGADGRAVSGRDTTNWFWDPSNGPIGGSTHRSMNDAPKADYIRAIRAHVHARPSSARNADSWSDIAERRAERNRNEERERERERERGEGYPSEREIRSDGDAPHRR